MASTSRNTSAACNLICSPLMDDFGLIVALLHEHRSKLLPPRFSYSHPDNPKYGEDEYRQNRQSGVWRKGTGECKHREEKESLRLIMDAVAELARSSTAPHPFLAIEGLNMHIAKEDLQRELSRLNTDEWRIGLINPCFGEFDVILIGETFGVIIFEVKGSEFSGKFTEDGPMPDRYAKAFEQLNSADSLFLLLDHFKFGANSTTIPQNDSPLSPVPLHCAPPMPIRKIVIATRLSKDRFDLWLSGLEQKDKSAAEDIIGSTRQWFKEDVENGSITDNLRKLIDEPGFSIDPKEFRRRQCILAFLKAYPILKKRNNPCRLAKLESLFSERHARMNDVAALQLQNTDIVAENPKVKIKGKVIIFTAEQEAALRGPDRHLIFGTGGTGKTVVLIQRAIDCLNQGRSVLVLTTESYMQSYHDRLNPAGMKFEIQSRPYWLWTTLDAIPNCARIIWDVYRHEVDIVELASRVSRESGEELFRFLDGFDDVIIDDALDYTKTVERRMNTNMKALFFSLAMMAYVKEYCPSKTIWIGLDQKAVEWRHNRHSRIFRDTMERLRTDAAMSSVLTRVMRSGEEIFKLAYEPNFARHLEPYKPVCGHKIPGVIHRATIRTDGSSMPSELLWNELKVHLDKYLLNQNYKPSDIGILVGGTEYLDQSEKVIRFLLEKCRVHNIPAETLDYEKLHNENLTGSKNPMAPANEVDKVSIDFWHQASSVEWPIVIHIDMIDFGRVTCPFDADRIHHQYRARTRAVSELVEIRVVPRTTREVLLKCGGSNCCTREIEMYREEMDSLDSSGSKRWFPSTIHDFHGKRKCPQFADGTFRSERWTERLDDVVNVALQLRDDLYRDMDQLTYCISGKTRSDYETRLFSKIRKRCHSISDFRSINDARHPALVLDYDLFEIVTRRRDFPFDQGEVSSLRNLEEIETYFKTRSASFRIWAVKRNIIHLMEKVLRWKVQEIPTKEERREENERHQDIFAKALDSFKDIEKFSECVTEVARTISAVSPALAEYFRLNLMEIYEGDRERGSNHWDSVKNDREIWRH